MYSMQGIVRKSVNNSINQFERLGYVANNLANLNTRGYKNVSFEQMLKEDGYLTAAIRTDFKQGSIQVTSNPYDVAIKGNGFIVGEGIKIPTNCYKFEIKPNGEVYSYDAANTQPKKLGTIPLVRFPSQENLEQAGMNKLVPTEDSGEPELVKNHDCICQNNLENSNTNIYSSTSEMLRLNASMLASMRMIKVVDDMYNKAINIRE